MSNKKEPQDFHAINPDGSIAVDGRVYWRDPSDETMHMTNDALRYAMVGKQFVGVDGVSIMQTEHDFNPIPLPSSLLDILFNRTSEPEPQSKYSYAGTFLRETETGYITDKNEPAYVDEAKKIKYTVKYKPVLVSQEDGSEIPMTEENLTKLKKEV